MSWPALRTPRRTSHSTCSTLPLPPHWCVSVRGNRGATTSPTPSSNTPCMRTWVPPASPGPIARWPKPSKTSSGTAPRTGLASWPATGSTLSSPETWPRPSTIGVGRPAPIVEGLGQVSGLDGVEPVAGQLAKPVLGAVPEEVFEGFGHLAMGPGEAGGTQVRIQGVLDEGVGEVVAPRFPRCLLYTSDAAD